MLRIRLIIWYSILVLLTIAAIAVVQHILLRNSLTEALDSSLIEDSRATLALISALPIDRGPHRFSEAPRAHHPGSLRDLIDEVLTELPDSLNGSDLTDRVMSRLIDEILVELASPDSSGAIGDPINAIVQRSVSNRRNNMIEIHHRLGYQRSVKDIPPIIFQTANLGGDTLASFVERQAMGIHDSVASLGQVKFHNEKIRIARAANDRFEVYIGYPTTDISESLRRIQLSFLYLLPLALIVSALGGLWLARKALRPIEQIADTAREISVKNLSQRIELPGKTDRELATLTQTLNSMFGRLEVSFRQISQFTSDASHELKTPLAILKGEIEQSQRHLEATKTLAPDEAGAMLESLMEEVERMHRIVEGLLLLSRADDRQLPLTKESVLISDYLASISEDAAILAEERGLTLSTALDARAAQTKVLIDTTRFYQVLMNILDNALKYTLKKGQVIIFLEQKGDRVEFGVRDTGIGIGPEDLTKIFQRFFRTDSARSGPHDDAERSLGLGLAIVKSIVEAHDGEIFVKSQVGKGTTFTISLPVLGKSHLKLFERFLKENRIGDSP